LVGHRGLALCALAASCLCASALSCADACDKGAGGGKPALEVAAQVHLTAAAPLVGTGVDKALDIDDDILAAADLTGPLEVIVVTGAEGPEAYALLAARSDAEARLAARYQLEPLMHEQVRIKPRDGRPCRCMLLAQEISCALITPRASNVGVWVARQERLVDAGEASPATRIDGRWGDGFFAGRVGELVRQRLRSLLAAQQLVAPLDRAVAAADLDALAPNVRAGTWHGSFAGERVVLDAEAQLAAAAALPQAPLGAFAATALRLPRDVTFAYALRRRPGAELPPVVASALGDGYAQGQRAGKLFEAYEVRDEAAARTALEQVSPGERTMQIDGGALWVTADATLLPSLAPLAAAGADVVLVIRAAVGGGTLEARLRVVDGSAQLHIELDRAAAAALARALSSPG
jgi:hypothetical protein